MLHSAHLHGELMHTLAEGVYRIGILMCVLFVKVCLYSVRAPSGAISSPLGLLFSWTHSLTIFFWGGAGGGGPSPKFNGMILGPYLTPPPSFVEIRRGVFPEYCSQTNKQTNRKG